MTVNEPDPSRTPAQKKVVRKRAADSPQPKKARKRTAATSDDAVTVNEPNDDQANTSPEYDRFASHLGQMRKAWIVAIRRRKLEAFDRHLINAEFPSLARLVQEVHAFLGATGDPYEAVAAVRRKREESMADEDDDEPPP